MNYEKEKHGRSETWLYKITIIIIIIYYMLYIK